MRTLELVSVAWLLLQLLLLPLAMGDNKIGGQAKTNCQATCGNVSIGYPFGMDRKECYLSEEFKVNCNDGVATLAKVDLDHMFVLSEIRFPNQVRLESQRIMAVDCTNYNMERSNYTYDVSFRLDKPFAVSGRSNRFRAMGCDTTSYVNTTDNSFTSRCETEWMLSSGGGVKHGGLGQCQIAVPDGSVGYSYVVTDRTNYNRSACTGKCSYAVLADEGFQFTQQVLEILLKEVPTTTSLSHLSSESTRSSSTSSSLRYPLVAEWAIQVGSCDKYNHTSRICGPNTWCNYTTSGPSGYHCYCNRDCDGNPYLDGAAGCRTGDSHFPAVPVALAGGVFLAATLGASSYTYGSWAQKKAIMKVTSKILQELHSVGDVSPPDAEFDHGTYSDVADPSAIDDVGDPDVDPDDPNTGEEKPKDFNQHDLKKAIKLYQKGRRVAIWASRRRVASANLPGQGPVEIRKYTVQESSQLRCFVRGIRLLSRISRIAKPPNISKLLGISTRERSLIFSQFSDRTLRASLRGSPSDRPSWEERLKIAVGTARGLAFAHSKSLYHGNVKSSNILLDERCNCRLVEFGVARLLRKNTLLNSSRGYVDPEYMNSGTNELTWCMDVYSFGVVLVELITGQDPGSKAFNREGRSLASVFLSALDKGQLDEVVDNGIWAEERKDQLLHVAEIAKECLLPKGNERPKMLSVRDKLYQYVPRALRPQGRRPANAPAGRPRAEKNYDWKGQIENSRAQIQPLVEEEINEEDSALSW